ncbi:MAG TPA: gluconate:H+ symporter, partial [Flavisolibacter sp.]|nr:gluconate:H+ symporter [Flavisolibacter sp.]
EKGIGDTLGSIAGIIVLGAMLGKLVAESGAAEQIASSIVQRVGLKYIRWALALAGFIIGIPLFYGVGFVLMIPLIFSVVYQYKLPAVSIGLPMLAALSVSFGFLPPHPSPSALVVQFNASMGTTILFGILIAIPTIILAGPVFSRSLMHIVSVPLQAFEPVAVPKDKTPSTVTSFLVVLLPILLFVVASLLPFAVSKQYQPVVSFLAQPTVVLLIALAFATYALGIRKGRTMKNVMGLYGEAVKEVALILLIIGGAGSLKQVLIDSGVSLTITEVLRNIALPPLFLAWLIAALIRVAVGSATVAGFTAAGIIQPLVAQTHTNPSLMVLAIGAGSLMFSHVNDSGFWMFKEYFNISIKDTLRSWSLMETIVSVCGLAGVLLLNMIF